MQLQLQAHFYLKKKKKEKNWRIYVDSFGQQQEVRTPQQDQIIPCVAEN